MNNKMKIGAVIGFTGAMIAFYIGAGFATFQEVLQYEASYGNAMIVVVITLAIIYLYTNFSFATVGSRVKVKRGGEIYDHYCGRAIGKFFDWFCAIYCYICFFVMCGGANSTIVELFGYFGVDVPNGIGAVIITVTAIATVIFGLNGIVNALGKLGPIIVVLILFVAIWTVGTSISGYDQGIKDMEAMVADGTVATVGGNPLSDVAPWSNPIFAALSYSGFVIMWFAAFMSELGAKNNLKEVNAGVVGSIVCIGAAAILCSIALISTASESCVKDIPSLYLAMKISPIFGVIYAVIVFCGIYTTSVPLLWTGITRITPEGTPKYKITVAIGAIVGCLIACFVPYQGLVNFIYGTLGYVGFILVFFMIIYDIRTKMGKNPIAPQMAPFAGKPGDLKIAETSSVTEAANSANVVSQQSETNKTKDEVKS